MDILHELLEIKDIVEGPAKDGAGEGESHGVEGAVQDDPVHPVALGLADCRGVRGDPCSHGMAVDDQPGGWEGRVFVCWLVKTYLACSPTLSLTSRIAATAS